MRELAPYIGADIDVPAGDIGVGGREINYMFAMYKTLIGEFGVLTGKTIGTRGSDSYRGNRVLVLCIFYKTC